MADASAENTTADLRFVRSELAKAAANSDHLPAEAVENLRAAEGALMVKGSGAAASSGG